MTEKDYINFLKERGLYEEYKEYAKALDNDRNKSTKKIFEGEKSS